MTVTSEERFLVIQLWGTGVTVNSLRSGLDRSLKSLFGETGVGVEARVLSVGTGENPTAIVATFAPHIRPLWAAVSSLSSPPATVIRLSSSLLGAYSHATHV